MRNISFFVEIFEFRYVITQLVKQYLQMRYKHTMLGFLWTLFTPLLTMSVMAIVFSQLMRFGLKDFVVYLLSGLVPWWVFANGIFNSGNSLLNNEAVIKKIYVPKQVFPTASMTGVVIDSLFSTLALFVIAFFMGMRPTVALTVLPISFILLIVFVYGIVLVQSVAVVYFRDLGHVVPILVQTLFYLTPVLYPISYIPEHHQYLLKLNPMYDFVELFHQPIYYGTYPQVDVFLAAGIMAVVSLGVGLYVFTTFSDRLIFRM